MLYIANMGTKNHVTYYQVGDTSDNSLEWYTASALKQIIQTTGVSIRGTKFSSNGRLLCRCVSENELLVAKRDSRLQMAGKPGSYRDTSHRIVYDVSDQINQSGYGTRVTIPVGGEVVKTVRLCHVTPSEIIIPDSYIEIAAGTFDRSLGWRGYYSDEKSRPEAPNWIFIKGGVNVQKIGRGSLCSEYLTGDFYFPRIARIEDRVGCYANYTRVLLPKSLQVLGAECFCNMPSLQYVEFEAGMNLSFMGWDCFRNLPSKPILRMDKALYERFKNVLPSVGRYELR